MPSFNLADLFEIVADAAPDRLALVAGDARRTYADLEARANRAAAALAAAGVGPGDRVAILSYNRAEWLEAQIAAFKLRAAAVNVNYRYTAGELAHVIADSGAKALVAERSLAARLNGVRDTLPELRQILLIEDGDDSDVPGAEGYEEALAAASPERVSAERSGDDLFLLYTGGTTGLPKGVMWRAEDMFFQAMGGGRMIGDPVTRPEEAGENAAAGGLTIMVTAPLMHAAGIWISWAAFTSGSTLVLWTGRSFDTTAVLRVAEAEQVQVMNLVGDAMARPIADLLSADAAAFDLSSLLVLACGGSATSPDVKERLTAALPHLMTVLDAMGGSETGVAAAGVEPDEHGNARFAGRPGMAVLDEKLRPIQPGSNEIGVFARSGRIPIGYWNDPDKTAATFVTDADGVRWALQGDMARVDAEGFMVLLGRGSTVINSGGEKVYAEEVETAVKSHPSVYDALVVGVPDERFGQRVAAVVATTAPLDAEELRDHCRRTLAGYKVPREVRFVAEVRRTPTGKADYRWAKQAALEGA
ncbi:acyl-CoA synthetase [Actinocorallia sp. API 0066]|uniref:acyl-CoA synthetase n=1 Tax=Actinocorallia sp. API 0066 TaxID=2896846 RepID=UPI001E4997D8|nr:acyl-CoA synthetase [Actinocorallia sp. API 0066]MCD0449575.1 acyl-CoA synthetase [Actinocorallia sp. API 0066]